MFFLRSIARSFLALAVAASIAARAPAQGTPPRFPIQQFELAQGVSRAVAADFSGDGLLDFAVTCPPGNAVGIVVALPGGTFATPSLIGGLLGPGDIASGDFDGNGLPDLVVSQSASQSVATMLALGGGALGAPTSQAAGFATARVVVGDFNGDGALEIVASDAASGNVALLAGAGNGTFAPPTTWSAGGTPSGLVIGDLNLDGKLDLVTVCTSTNQGSVLLGNGAGGFGAPSLFGAGLFPIDVKVGLIDADPNPDVAIGFSMGGASFLKGDGAGGFNGSVPLGPDVVPFSIDLVDVDADADLDLVVAGAPTHFFSPNLFVLLGDGAGNFASGPSARVGATLTDAVAADVTGDGRIDFVVLHRDTRLAAVLQLQAGSFHLPTVLSSGNMSPNGAAAADFDGDGIPDLAAVDSSGFVEVFLGDGSFGFTAKPPCPTGGGGTDLALGDLNGDGNLDVVTASPGHFGVAVLLGSATGNLTFFASSNGSAINPQSVIVADLDLDGDADAATANAGSNDVCVFCGNGTGTLTPVGPGIPVAGQTLSLACADLNGDGVPDLAAAIWGSASVATLHGTGGALFAPGTVFASGGLNPTDVVAADFTGDGAVDLVVANSGSDVVTVHIGTGTGGFAPGPTLATKSAFRVAVGDLSGDGIPDIAAVRSFDLAIGLGTGGGGMAAPIHAGWTADANAIALGDLDGDGDADVATTLGFVNVSAMRNAVPAAPSTAPFGSGTPGCFGTLSVGASAPPSVGNAAFRITWTNAPRSALGLAFVADAADFFGTDLFGLGVKLHVDPLASTLLLGFNATSDASGFGSAAVPIPANPALIGAVVYAQGVWVEPPWMKCAASVAGLVSSEGLAITIAP